MIYFTFKFVETRGQSLEEMDYIFSDPHPVRPSLVIQKVALQEMKEDDVNVVQAES
ncbi:hypothetical protein OG21DRAFT_1507572 [Imleria badia]|nr:hypothetical protein OG21DRAFT_1507572 [Imleria badia]